MRVVDYCIRPESPFHCRLYRPLANPWEDVCRHWKAEGDGQPIQIFEPLNPPFALPHGQCFAVRYWSLGEYEGYTWVKVDRVLPDLPGVLTL